MKEKRKDLMKHKLLLLFVFIIAGCLSSFASCPGDTARFTTTAGACNNTTISFTNTSVGGATTYFWDFGDTTTMADTATVMSPGAYTYPGLGIYTATLIIDRGMPCADTFKAVVNMAFVAPIYTSSAPQCVTDSVSFTDASVAGPGSTVTQWYWDFGQTGNSDTSIVQHPKHKYSAGNVAYNVKLIVTSSDGCKDSITQSIILQSAVIVNAGTDITSCVNNPTVTLAGSVTNAGGGVWTGTGGFSSLTSLTATYTPTDSAKAHGKDTLVLTSFSSPYCPNKSDTVFINFNPAPTANVGADITVCKDVASIPVTAALTGAAGGVWHTTSIDGSFTDDSVVTTFYHPGLNDTATGTVTLYLETTGNGICAAVRDSLVVTFSPTPTVLIKSGDSVCSNSSVVLDVEVSTGSGTWSSTGSGLFLPTNTSLNGVYTPSAADILAGTITLIFTSSNNGDCQPVIDSLPITILPAPAADYTVVSACEGSPVQYTDNSTSASGVTGWNWVFGDLSIPNFTPSPSHTYSSCGNKIVALTVTAGNGCVDIETKTVQVYCLPTANYTAIGVCLNNGTEFTNTSAVSGATIASTNWNFGDMATSTDANPSHSYASSGSYTVSLVVVSSQGCSDTFTQTLSIYTNPTVDFEIQDTTLDIGQPVNLIDHSVGATGWHWQVGNSNPSFNSNMVYSSNWGGVYSACLEITDANGCKDTACKDIIVSTVPHAPSGFSPNGDGQNDVFYIYGGPFKKVQMNVFNNWGEVIFTSTDLSVGWDGKYKGEDQPVGVYVYTVVGVTEDDKEYKISGDITLLR